MYEKLYAHFKAQFELDLMRKKKPMGDTFELIKEFCDAFPEIKFDQLKMCFYNEPEEIALWAAKGHAIEGDGHASTKPPGRDCCTIL